MAQNRLAILQATRDLTARGDLKMPRLMPLQNWPVFQAVWSTVTLIQNQLLVEVLTDAAMQEIRILESIYREDLPPKKNCLRQLQPL